MAQTNLFGNLGGMQQPQQQPAQGIFGGQQGQTPGGAPPLFANMGGGQQQQQPQQQQQQQQQPGMQLNTPIGGGLFAGQQPQQQLQQQQQQQPQTGQQAPSLFGGPIGGAQAAGQQAGGIQTAGLQIGANTPAGAAAAVAQQAPKDSNEKITVQNSNQSLSDLFTTWKRDIENQFRELQELEKQLKTSNQEIQDAQKIYEHLFSSQDSVKNKLEEEQFQINQTIKQIETEQNVMEQELLKYSQMHNAFSAGEGGSIKEKCQLIQQDTEKLENKLQDIRQMTSSLNDQTKDVQMHFNSYLAALDKLEYSQEFLKQKLGKIQDKIERRI